MPTTSGRRARWPSTARSATFYITAGCLAGGQPFWPAEMRYLVRGDPRAARCTLERRPVTLELDR